MANKITFSNGLTWNGVDPLSDKGQFTVDQVGDNAIYNIQDVGTSAEAILLGDVLPGFVHFKNLDTTNFVTIGNDNAVTTVVSKLLPGECMTLRTTTATWYAKADSAAIQLLVLAADL
jgi:hypothetical protein